MDSTANIGRIKREIGDYVSRASPGLLNILELYCRGDSGLDCVTLLLEEPGKLKDIIMRIYVSPETVRFVARLFLNPLAEVCGLGIEELIRLFMERPTKLREVLQQALTHAT